MSELDTESVSTVDICDDASDTACMGAWCVAFQTMWFTQEFAILRTILFFCVAYTVLRYGYYNNDHVLLGVFVTTAVGSCMSRLCYIVFCATFVLLMLRGIYITDGTFSVQWKGATNIMGVPVLGE